MKRNIDSQCVTKIVNQKKSNPFRSHIYYAKKFIPKRKNSVKLEIFSFDF